MYVALSSCPVCRVQTDLNRRNWQPKIWTAGSRRESSDSQVNTTAFFNELRPITPSSESHCIFVGFHNSKALAGAWRTRSFIFRPPSRSAVQTIGQQRFTLSSASRLAPKKTGFTIQRLTLFTYTTFPSFLFSKL